MAILLICEDVPNSYSLRQSHLQTHLDYIATIVYKIHIAGPTSPSNNGYNGSCFIYHTDDVKTAETLFFNDPYYQAGIYQTFSFCSFKPAAGTWIGGARW